MCFESSNYTTRMIAICILNMSNHLTNFFAYLDPGIQVLRAGHLDWDDEVFEPLAFAFRAPLESQYQVIAESRTTARERQRDHKQFFIGKSGDTYRLMVCPVI